MMVYAKWSFDYLVVIGLLRRLGLLALYGLHLIRRHLRELMSPRPADGLGAYLR